MDYDEFISALPLDRTVVFRSAEENQETMQHYGVNQETRQLGRGKFRCDLALRSTAQADLFADRFNRACSMRIELPADSVGLLLLRSASGHALASGENAANDRLVVVPGGSGVDLVAPDLFGSEALTVPKDRFVEAMEALCPASKPDRWAELGVIEGDKAQLQSLRSSLLGLIAAPERDPLGESLGNLLTATFTWMGHRSSHWKAERLIGNGARRHVAKLTQEFIEEHYREAVGSEELCRLTGVGVRTLQRCFREYFDLTISEYLKTVRLDAAHRELLATRPAHCSVTEIALRHGFGHLGRFSVEFRERFGESPRQVRAREVPR